VAGAAGLHRSMPAEGEELRRSRRADDGACARGGRRRELGGRRVRASVRRRV